jgi:ribonuclease Z
LARHTLACGDTVGGIAQRAGVRTLALTHHRPRPDDTMLEALRHEVAAAYSGQLVIGDDLTTLRVEPSGAPPA